MPLRQPHLHHPDRARNLRTFEVEPARLQVQRDRISISAHLDRLRSSAQALAFAEIPTHEAITAEIKRTLAANSMTDGVHIRLTLTPAR